MAKGLKITDLEKGKGKEVNIKDIVHFHCLCTFSNGKKVFNSKEEHAYQVRVGARDSFVAFDQGLIGMRIGGKRKIKVPPQLARYEKEMFPYLPENSILYYEIELLNIVDQWDNTLHIRTSPLLTKEIKLLEERYSQLEPSSELNSEFQQIQTKLFKATNKILKKDRTNKD